MPAFMTDFGGRCKPQTREGGSFPTGSGSEDRKFRMKSGIASHAVFLQEYLPGTKRRVVPGKPSGIDAGIFRQMPD